MRGGGYLDNCYNFIKKMFSYILDTVIWPISLFAADPSAHLPDVDILCIYFCFIYPIYIFSRLNLLQTDGKTYNFDIPF